jgi:hypothetical protein
VLSDYTYLELLVVEISVFKESHIKVANGMIHQRNDFLGIFDQLVIELVRIRVGHQVATVQINTKSIGITDLIDKTHKKGLLKYDSVGTYVRQ